MKRALLFGLGCLVFGACATLNDGVLGFSTDSPAGRTQEFQRLQSAVSARFFRFLTREPYTINGDWRLQILLRADENGRLVPVAIESVEGDSEKKAVEFMVLALKEVGQATTLSAEFAAGLGPAKEMRWMIAYERKPGKEPALPRNSR